MASQQKTKLVLGIAAALVSLAGVAAGVAATTNKQSDSDCSIQGDDNSLICEDRGTLSPSASIVAGPVDGTWSLELRNWEPNSVVSLQIVDPSGVEQPMGEFGRRQVDAGGAADSRDGFYFWKYVDGEPLGVYTLEASGTDASGDVKERVDTFEVPARNESG